MKPITQLKNLLTLLAFLTLQLNCKAWGPDGHKLIVKIAYSQLTAAEKDSLAKYLRGASLDEAAVWMDEVKSDRAYDFQKPYHYINIDKDSVYNPADTANIVWELNRVLAELKDRRKYTPEHIEIDFKILIHLMGDLHQPLHVGYAKDVGGNTVQVYYNETSTNLHRVWDTEIIKDAVLGNPPDWAKVSLLTPGELASTKHIDFVTWMNESRSKLNAVYDFTGDEISHKYVVKNTPVVERQLLLAGLRLAVVLKTIFRS